MRLLPSLGDLIQVVKQTPINVWGGNKKMPNDSALKKDLEFELVENLKIKDAET